MRQTHIIVGTAGHVDHGKTHLTIAIGCTGGRHRSVAIANNLYEKIASRGYQVQVEHRDCEKDDYSKL